MTHVDPDVLALVALDEPVDDDVRAHLTTCDQCRAEVAALAAVVGVARSVTPGDVLVAPPPHVWEDVRAELGLAVATVADDDVPPGQRAVPAPDHGDELAAARRRRASRTPWVAAGAAAGLVIGVAGTAWLTGREAAPQVVAETRMDALPGWAAEGEAVVRLAADGTRELVVTLTGAPEDGGYREVWLIDRDVTRLVSVGVLVGTEGRYVLPDGLDLAEFPVVDVSEESYDGDPAHSGDSIVRGDLDA